MPLAFLVNIRVLTANLLKCSYNANVYLIYVAGKRAQPRIDKLESHAIFMLRVSGCIFRFCKSSCVKILIITPL